MNQKRFARELNVSESYMSKLLSGSIKTYDCTLIHKINKLLKIPACYFFHDNECDLHHQTMHEVYIGKIATIDIIYENPGVSSLLMVYNTTQGGVVENPLDNFLADTKNTTYSVFLLKGKLIYHTDKLVEINSGESISFKSGDQDKVRFLTVYDGTTGTVTIHGDYQKFYDRLKTNTTFHRRYIRR